MELFRARWEFLFLSLVVFCAKGTPVPEGAGSTPTLGDETAVTSVGQTVPPPDSASTPSGQDGPTDPKPHESTVGHTNTGSEGTFPSGEAQPNSNEANPTSMINPDVNPEMNVPFHPDNVQYEESFVNNVNNDFKAIINTLENDMTELGEEDGKNLGHLIDLLEEIKRRIDLFKKDVSTILGPLQIHRHPHHPHHTPFSPLESGKPGKPGKPDKPEQTIPPKPTIPDRPRPPSKADKPGAPAETINPPAEAPAKPAAEKPAAEKPTAEKPAAEKPTAEKPAAEKPTAEKPAAEKPAVEKPAAGKPTDEKPAAEKPTAEKPAAEKPEPAKTELTPLARRKRSPYIRGYGGPYESNFLGGGLFGYGGGYGGLYGGGLFGGNSYGSGYAGGYPYYANGGWRPVGYGYGLVR